MKGIATIILLTLPIMGYTQQQDTLSTLGLEEITISTTRYEDRPAFNLLEVKSIQINNGYEVQTILNQVPGVYMHSGTLSTNRITIRGIGNRSLFSTAKLRAYLEEIPLTSGIGETSLEDIDLSLISEMEVWKGPAASRYGAGLGGLIHYRLPRQFTNGISIDNQWGNWGTLRNTGTVTIGNESLGSFVLNYNNTQTDGWRQNSEYQRRGINLLWNKVTDRSTTQVAVLGIDLFGEIPSSLNLDDFNEDPSQAAFTWNAIEGYEDYRKLLTGISHTRKLGSDWKLRTAFFLKTRDSYESRPFNILEDGDFAYGTRLTAEKETGRGRILTGLEFYLEDYMWKTFETNDGEKGAFLSNQEENRKYLNLFQEWQVDFDNSWSLTLGYNLNSTRYVFNDLYLQDGDLSGDYSFRWILSPQVNFRYRPSAKSMYYFMLSHGFSNPSLEETLTPEGIINEDLGPETGWNAELGSRGYFNDVISYDISLYNMWVDNLLVSRMQEDIMTGFDQIISVNAGRTNHLGIDLLVNATLMKGVNSSLDLNTTYSWQNYTFRDFIEEDDDYSGNSLTGTVPHRITSNLVLEQSDFNATLSYFFTDRIPMRDDNSVYSPAYSLMNFKLGYSLNLDFMKMGWYAGINNIFDVNYASMVLVNAGAFGNNLPRYYYPGRPRNFYAGVRMAVDF